MLDYAVSDYFTESSVQNGDYSLADYAIADYFADTPAVVADEIYRGIIYITPQDDLEKYNSVNIYERKESTNGYKFRY